MPPIVAQLTKLSDHESLAVRVSIQKAILVYAESCHSNKYPFKNLLEKLVPVLEEASNDDEYLVSVCGGGGSVYLLGDKGEEGLIIQNISLDKLRFFNSGQ